MDPPPQSPLASLHSKKETWKNTLLLSFQSLGVVYGRLSIAPLYVFGTISVADVKSEESLYGLVSFVFWTMTIIPLVKYAFVVLRADDNGEGGTFALYSLLCRHAKVGLLPNQKLIDETPNLEMGSPCKTNFESRARRAIEKHKSSHYLLLFLALFGSCMVIGDGVLTPALSVLSASSGLERSLSDISYQLFSSPKTQKSVSKALTKYVPVPTACVMLIGLFMLQKYGTRKIGFIFAPIIILWLFLIGGVGLYNIFRWNPHIISAISPTHIYKFIKHIDIKSWRSLGSILLCIAGSEAMFINLGHFSKKSIKITFIFLIYPVLLVSYAGEAAFISKNPVEAGYITDFGRSMPKTLHHVYTVLSLLASAVGSQATITATFSIINQCLALGCFPRVKVIHTSDKIHGQVYIPDINWVVMVLSLAVTVGFRDVGRIGNAAGLAIISGMLVTTCLMSLVIALYWEKNIWISACFLIVFGFVEAMYLSACLLSFHKGAWSLVVLLVISMTSMLAWHYGTKKKYEFDLENKVSMDWLTDLSTSLGVARIPGIGFIYTDIVTGIPAFFSHFITNLPAFHQVLIFVSFKSVPEPCVPPRKRYLIGRVGPKEYKVYRCIVRYGYCDRVRDTEDFEEHLISMIAEFISNEENDAEDLTSPEGKMVFVGNPFQGQNALIPLNETNSDMGSSSLQQNGTKTIQLGEQPEGSFTTVRRKKVKFLLPAEKGKIRDPVRKELQELVKARESGTAYFLGQTHLSVRDGSNFLKRFMIMIYIFLDKNCREPPVALNIPHAALVEVGMCYTI